MREPMKILASAASIGLIMPFVVVAYETIVYETYSSLYASLGDLFRIAPRIGALGVLLLGAQPEKASTEGLIRYLCRGRFIEARYALIVFLGSVLTIGFGLPAGTAGPLVIIGASAGYAFSRVLNVTGLRRNALILVGSSAALAAHLKAPLAATLFVFEVIAAGVLVERDALFVALASAESASVAGIVRSFFGLEMAYGEIPYSLPPMTLDALVIVSISGILCGLFSVFVVYVFEALFLASSRVRTRLKLFAAAATMGAVFRYFPAVLSPRLLAPNGPEALIYAVSKVAVAAITIVLGGIGGTLMPTLAAAIGFGKFLDYAFSVEYLLPIATAAVFGAASRCPLSAIVLALEVFDMDPRLTPRLVLATTVAMITHTLIADGLSLYTLSMYARQERLVSFYIDPLLCSRVRDVARRVPAIRRDEHLAKALYMMHELRVHALPIVDEEGKLIGIVTLGDFKRAFLMGVEVKPDDPVRKVSPKLRPITIDAEATLSEALDLMDSHNIDHLVVLDGDVILGVISRDDILGVTRKIIEGETRRKRPRLRHKRTRNASFRPRRSRRIRPARSP